MTKLCLIAGSCVCVVVFAAPAFSDARPPPEPVGERVANAEPQSAPALRASSLDGRRTSGRFLTNLGRNAVGVFAADSIKPFLITAAVTGLAAPFDDNVEQYFAPRRRAAWLGDLGATLGQPYVIGPAAAVLFGAGRLSGDRRFRDATYDIAQVTLVSAAYTTAIKFPTHRERPDGSNRLSFPSGHTSNAFAWAAVAAHHYGWKLGLPSYAFAGLIGVSRLEKNAHHLTDVLAAAGVGYICARTVVRRDSAGAEARATRFFLAPVFAAEGRGVAFSFTF